MERIWLYGLLKGLCVSYTEIALGFKRANWGRRLRVLRLWISFRSKVLRLRIQVSEPKQCA